jgi:tRNA(Ile)-lysidine synthase
MLAKVTDFMFHNRMTEEGDRIAVGVSGGADSVCLLYVLKKLSRTGKFDLAAVHVNHRLRGAEADRDEQFVRALCRDWDIDFYLRSYDVGRLAKEEGLSEEEAGRKVRYLAFLEVCGQQGYNKVAVAHNKNDNAETFLFHLFRGTGMKGLSGIDPCRALPADFGEVTVIRPLLCVERREIEDYLNREGIAYQTDSTNLTEDYSRNKIRNKILTYAAAEINTRTVGNINETALKLREALEYIDRNVTIRYQALVRQEKGCFRISAEALLKEPPVIQKGILRKLLEDLAGSLKDLEAGHIDAVLSLCKRQVGKQVQLPCGILAGREYEDIIICIKTVHLWENLEVEPMEPVKLMIPGRILIPSIRKILETKLIKYEKSEAIPKSSCVKWFDYDKIENAVEMRNRKEGDYIQINASGGNKRLKDYFIDRKIPRRQRDSQVLITDGSHVMWIPGEGERISEKYKVDETTSNILLMKLIDLEENEDDRQSKSHDIGRTGTEKD